MTAYKNLSVRSKLTLIIPIFVLGVIGLFAFNLSEFRSHLYQAREIQTKDVVEVAEGIVAAYHKRELANEMSPEEAQEAALISIRDIRYEGSEYFWIKDTNGIMLMHPIQPEMNGTNVMGIRDTSGRTPFQDMVDVVNSKGAGKVTYEWPKQGVEGPVMKTSYVLGFQPWGWIVGSGVYLDDIEEVFWDQVSILALVGTVILGAMVAALLVVSNTIASPVRTMTEYMHALADGDKTKPVPETDRKDEIGEMAKAVGVFKEAMIAADELALQEKVEQEKQVKRAKAINHLAMNFDANITEILRSVSSAATQMEATASDLSTTAEETSTQATTVAAASDEASNNVQTVASASEELSSSITEISGQVSRSTQITQKAVEATHNTRGTVKNLSESASHIGDVLSLITDIAEQTNLLALNATIEAARAGDAGKGFAVVASEVKNLANQTAKATEEIGSQITGIQTVTQQAVNAIEEVSAIISEINAISANIAAAIEQQQAATQEIARNVDQAAKGTQEVSRNIESVNQAASDTGTASHQVKDAANALSRKAETLKQTVSEFLDAVKSA